MYTPSLREEKGRAVGFTLLELLIVIGIMVILGTVLVLVLNPAETLKKSRDNQRISDLATVKTAIGLYTTTITTINLGTSADGSTLNNASCQAGSSWASELGTGKIYYSYVGSADSITDNTLDAVTFTTNTNKPANHKTTNAAASAVDGTGWLPVKLSDISGGSPISALPLDPTNNFVSGSVSAMGSTDLFYRYACNSDASTYEIDAQLESTAYTSTDDKRAKDGGNNSSYYEVGTNLSILGTGTDF